MTKKPKRSAAQYLPKRPTLAAMRKAVDDCRGCDLYKNATQGVFGEGKSKAKIVFVGEQPGDKEDLSGHPFVGSAGKLLDRALVDAGIPRENVYLTNAVKHFKWEARLQKRIHKKPSVREVLACRPWLSAEIRQIKPEIIVCLGATAAYAVFGRPMKIGENRSRFQPSEFSPNTFVTVHPSSILRSPDEASRHAEYARFVADLKLVAKR